VADPFLLEPLMTLKDQSRAWSAGYALLAVLLVAAGVLSVRRTKERRQDASSPAATASTIQDAPAGDTPVTWKSRVLWVLLAFAPSSLMLGATSFISTDLASVPLLWIMPLTVYLLTMIVAYSKPGPRATSIARIATPIVALAVAVTMLMQLKAPMSLLIGLHLLLLLTGAMACHGRLATLRPAPERLTEYFLLVSLGGVLGGSFNALLAPAIFNAVYEYPIAIALACWLGMSLAVPGRQQRPWWRPELLALDLILPVALIAALFGSWRVAMKLDREYDLSFALQSLVSFALPVTGCLALALWPRRFAAALGLIMLVAITSFGGSGRVKLAERSFFGVHRVVDTPDGKARKLLHGSTNHGMQLLDPAARAAPLTYYARTGPAGRVFEALNGSLRLSQVGLVGLGAGTLAAYARPGQEFIFFEIDPVVARVAADPSFFTYLSSSAGKVTTVLGDGRLTLQREQSARYDLIVLDAFSSDAIPVHLLTVEAFQVYLSRLSERGLLLLHLTNRHLELSPVIAGVCQKLGLVVRLNHHVPAAQEAAALTAESVWAMVARREADFGALALDPRWRPIEGRTILWTDDFSNIIDVLKH
jgi:hypothetical protein